MTKKNRNDSEQCSSSAAAVLTGDCDAAEIPIRSDACERVLGSVMGEYSLPIAPTTTALRSLLDAGWPPPTNAVVVVVGFGLLLFLVLAGLILRLLIRRRRAGSKLRQCGLPVVYWRPKNLFVSGRSYVASSASATGSTSSSDDPTARLLRSTNITNILPRMRRLQGPYGMYGTVYGMSTPVIHVAHPVPATAILSSAVATASTAASRTQPIADTKQRQRPSSSRRSGIATSAGATKCPAYDHFKNFCGDGVFTADGDDWRQKRAAVLHVLLRSSGGGGESASTSAGFGGVSTFETNVERGAHDAATKLIARLERSIDAAEGKNCPYQVNIVPMLQRTTLGLIYRYLTHQELPGDVELNNEHGNGNAQQRLTQQRDQLQKPREQSMLTRYLDSITQIRMIVLAQSRSVWFLLPRWCYRTFSRMYRDEEQTLQPIRAFSERACREALPRSPLYLLSRHFAPYCLPEVEPILAKSPLQAEASTPVSKHLLDEAITLLFAGQDTSAATLSWTLHLLSLYPAIQKKMSAEIATVLRPLEDDGDDSSSSIPLSRKVLMQLPYLDAVVKESMRLYPVAPFVVRRLPCDVPVHDLDSRQGTLPHEEEPLTLPKDSFVCIWIYSLHRNEQFWDRPNEFRPERWLVENGQPRDLGITNGAYMPFAIGPRNCVGQPMANIILRSLLANLVHHLEFTDPHLDEREWTQDHADARRKDMQAGFTVLPLGGVELCITRRRPPSGS